MEAAPDAVVEAILDPHGWWSDSQDDGPHLRLAGLVPGQQVVWDVLDASGDHDERIVFDVVADAEGGGSTVTVTHTPSRPIYEAEANPSGGLHLAALTSPVRQHFTSLC